MSQQITKSSPGNYFRTYKSNCVECKKEFSQEAEESRGYSDIFREATLFCPECLPAKKEQYEKQQQQKALEEKQREIEREKERVERQKIQAMEYAKQLFLNSGLPSKYLEASTDKTFLLERFSEIKKGGFFFGSVGTGKTTFMAVLIKILTIEKSIPCKFISSAKLVMQLQDMYRHDKESPFKYLDTLAGVKVLFLDDLGAEKLTDFVKQAFYYLINEREQWQLRTFISSNYDLSHLDRIFESRIASRIAGMCEVVEFSGKDMRVEK